ncbi:MAG: hypothetical protein U0354_20395 [Candidatus Sericytochromatia bacterium]
MFYHDASIKNFTREEHKYQFDIFYTHINDIWHNNINSKYEITLYKWQSKVYEIREKSFNLIHDITFAFEFLLENKHSKFNLLADKINEVLPAVIESTKLHLRMLNKKEELSFKKEMNIIDEWITNLDTFLNYFLNFKDKEKSNIPNQAIQNVRQKLSEMQKSYNFIIDNSGQYFKINELEKKEFIYYNRLSNTYKFLVLNPELKFYKPIARKEIEKWHNNIDIERIKKINELLYSQDIQLFVKENFPKIEIIKPLKTIENESIRTCIIGIKGITINDLESEFTNVLVLILLELSKLDIDITEFILVFIDENNYADPIGLNFWRKNLYELIKLLEQNIQPTNEQLKFIFQPKIITEGHLSSLSGNYFLIKENENSIKNNVLKTLLLLKDLSIARESLDKNSEIELKMLDEYELEYKSKINDFINNINLSILPNNIAEKFKNIESISEEEFRNFYYQIINLQTWE